MLFLVLLLVPSIFATQCPAPEVNDYTKTHFRYTPEAVEDFYRPGSVINFDCRHGTESLNSNGSPHGRKCLQNGTWTGEPLICGINVAKNIPIITDSGSCNLEKKSCKPSTEWKVNVKEAADISGVKIALSSDYSQPISVEGTTAGGDSTPCSFRKSEDNTFFAFCQISQAKTVAISSETPILLEKMSVISTTTGFATGSTVDCPWPGSPAGGKIAEYLENSHVTYRCVDGYQLVGAANRSCNTKTGTYDQKMPECSKEN